MKYAVNIGQLIKRSTISGVGQFRSIDKDYSKPTKDQLCIKQMREKFRVNIHISDASPSHITSHNIRSISTKSTNQQSSVKTSAGYSHNNEKVGSVELKSRRLRRLQRVI